MERARSAPPPSSADADVASVPRGLPSLEALVEGVRAPGADRSDVDALLAGLARPLPPDQSARERADLLLSLIEDSRLSSFTGSRGRTVRDAAIKALVALGYPYALEVPPDALALAGRLSDEPAKLRKLLNPRGWVGLGIIVLASVLPLASSFYSVLQPGRVDLLMLIILAIDLGVMLFPTLLTLLGQYFRVRLLKGIGMVGQIAYALFFAVPNLFHTSHSTSVLSVITGGLLLLGTGLMALRPES